MLPILSVVVPPEPVVSLVDAKAHLRVESGDDDALIAGYVAAATMELDGATGWLGCALGLQTLAVTGAHFPGHGVHTAWCGEMRACTMHEHEMRLACPPVRSVVAVDYLDPAGVGQVLDPSSYRLVDRYLLPARGRTWPAPACEPDAVTVTYVAGYAGGKLPAPIRAAILLKLGALYGTRVDAAMMASSTSSALLASWRVFW